MEEGALTSIKNEEKVIPKSEATALKKRIKQLERALGQKTLRRYGVSDGTRTRDNRNHNPGLYQLSYAHHNCY